MQYFFRFSSTIYLVNTIFFLSNTGKTGVFVSSLPDAEMALGCGYLYYRVNTKLIQYGNRWICYYFCNYTLPISAIIVPAIANIIPINQSRITTVSSAQPIASRW